MTGAMRKSQKGSNGEGNEVPKGRKKAKTGGERINCSEIVRNGTEIAGIGTEVPLCRA
jgi:hypothetical protein